MYILYLSLSTITNNSKGFIIYTKIDITCTHVHMYMYVVTIP